MHRWECHPCVDSPRGWLGVGKAACGTGYSTELPVFWNILDNALRHMAWFLSGSFWSQKSALMILMAPFQLGVFYHFMILWISRYSFAEPLKNTAICFLQVFEDVQIIYSFYHSSSHFEYLQGASSKYCKKINRHQQTKLHTTAWRKRSKTFLRG